MTITKATHVCQDIVGKGMKTKEEEKVEWGRGEVRGGLWKQVIHPQISRPNGVESLGTAFSLL